MQVTLIDLETGKSEVRTLRATARKLNLPINRLYLYKRAKVKLFDKYVISFDTKIFKTQGLIGNINQYNEKLKLKKQLEEQEMNNSV
jgi:hypothetical protein